MARHATLRATEKNIYEQISKYPGYGMGFKVFRRSWPADSYFHIKKIDIKVNTGANNIAKLFIFFCFYRLPDLVIFTVSSTGKERWFQQVLKNCKELTNVASGSTI